MIEGLENLYESSNPSGSSRNIVSIVRGQNIPERVSRAIEMVGGIERFVNRGDKVLIKPNLVDGKPYETGETVHTETIRTLIRLVRNAGASQISVGDAITSRDLTLYETVARIAEEEGGRFVDFEQGPWVEADVPNPVFFKKVTVAKALLECDVLVNVPALKTHHIAGVTVALKNLFGTIPWKERANCHRNDKIEEIIVDLNILKPSNLIVVDGGYSTHHIPAFEVQRLDLTLAGDNAVLIDAVAAKVMGHDPKTLRYLVWAEERGLGSSDLTKCQIEGLSIEEAFRRRTVNMVDFVNRTYGNLKIINGGACTGCYGRIATMLTRYLDPRSKKKLYVLMGPEVKLPDIYDKEAACLLCGNCLAPTFYNRLKGEFIPGCPPTLEEFRKILEKLGCEPRIWGMWPQSQSEGGIIFRKRDHTSGSLR